MRVRMKEKEQKQFLNLDQKKKTSENCSKIRSQSDYSRVLGHCAEGISLGERQRTELSGFPHDRDQL